MMKNYAVTMLTVCLLGLTWTSLSLAAVAAKSLVSLKEADVSRAPPTVLEVDLRKGVTSALPAGVTWYSQLTSGEEECECDRQGVLKLTFSSQRVRAQVNLTFEHSNEWTFQVADSRTNNGWAGDSGTQQNDAEVHSYSNNIYFYGRDNPTGGTYGLLHSQANFVAVHPHTTVTLNLADQLATAHNGLTYLYVNSHKLFALNGQPDDGGVNYDVYLAMNRVVGPGGRTGTGLCKVRVQFFDTPL